MDPKRRPNRAQYLQTLRAMTPAQRLEKAFELSEFTRQLFLAGLRKRHPDARDAEIRRLALSRLHRCHNRNY